MILYLLVALDVIGGMVLLAKLGYLMFWLGFAVFAKGAWSLFMGIKSGNWLDWMGAVDVFGGICMLLTSYGYNNSIFVIAGIALVIKGMYSFICSLH